MVNERLKISRILNSKILAPILFISLLVLLTGAGDVDASGLDGSDVENQNTGSDERQTNEDREIPEHEHQLVRTDRVGRVRLSDGSGIVTGIAYQCDICGAMFGFPIV